MWYEDLTECDYWGEEYAKILTAVGWLETGKTYLKGKSPKLFYDKLCESSKNPWMLSGMIMGFHECDICEFQFEFQSPMGKLNLFIPHNGKIYVCPELITHYINAHFYLPPNEFIEAVLACPLMRSMDYLKKMLENGGRELIRLNK